MRTDLFDFHLPEGVIANRPANPRDSARLLHVRRDGWTDMVVRDLPSLLRPHDVMVFNDTKVIPARLLGRRGDMKVEFLLHRQMTDGQWEVFAKPAKRLKPDQVVRFDGGLEAVVVEKTPDGLVRVGFNALGSGLIEKLHAVGHVPLPPYIGRQDDAQDRTDYQTIYAAKEGSVAAPTAGLHFTTELLAAIDRVGTQRLHVTLHVGAGTFLPVKVDDTNDHKMHLEWGEVGPRIVAQITDAKAKGGRVISVGTTSMRLLEAAAASGVLQPFSGETGIFITPGYRFNAVDVLMTNFHLPKSTLFMLVSAFSGRERMLAAYRHAMSTGYRFYSYGDSSWLERMDDQ